MRVIKKIAAKDADQYMLRLPPGLRDRVAHRAAENGRSMNTEIVEAIEKHLEGADRMTRVWDFIEKHRENVEAISSIRQAVEGLEAYVGSLGKGEFYGVLTALRDKAHRDAEIAALPMLTNEQAKTIRTLLQEINAKDPKFLEDKFLEYLGAKTIEQIRGFERALAMITWKRDNPR
jgi:predicted DNA-binding protein